MRSILHNCNVIQLDYIITPFYLSMNLERILNFQEFLPALSVYTAACEIWTQYYVG